MHRRSVPATPHHAKHSDHAVPSPEAVSTGPDGAPSGAAPTASAGILPGATPAHPGRKRRGARMLAASAALVLALSACGGDEPPDNGLDGTIPDLSTSSDNGGASDNGGTNDAASDAGGNSGSEDLAASIPAPDPADYPGMDQNTPEGAEQAFKYYIAVVIWSYQTGSTDTLSQLYTGECTACASFTDEIEAAKASSLTWGTTDLTPIGTKVYESPHFDHEIGYKFTVGAHDEPNEKLTGLETVDSTTITAVGGLVWENNTWLVSGYVSEVEGD